MKLDRLIGILSILLQGKRSQRLFSLILSRSPGAP